MEPIIVNAANMFIYSLTGIGLRGTTHQATLARRAARALKQEVAQNDIFFSKKLKHALGLHRYDRGKKNSIIYINYKLRNNLLGISLMLAHEAVHTQTSQHEIDEELNARRVAILYFQDLTRLQWTFPAHDGSSMKSERLQRGFPVDKELTMSIQESCDDHHQLIDLVLQHPDYQEYIDTAWVRKSLQREWWGGLVNRWPSTRGFYVKLFAEESQKNASNTTLKMDNALAIKNILESLFKELQLAPNELAQSEKSWVIAFGKSVGGEQGMRNVRSALEPLLGDQKMKRELEALNRRLVFPILEPAGPPKL